MYNLLIIFMSIISITDNVKITFESLWIQVQKTGERMVTVLNWEVDGAVMFL